MRKILYLLLLLSISLVGYAQTSWNYSLWFHLTDAAGSTISPEDFLDQDIELVTFSAGGYRNSRLEYDTLTNYFKFSQLTIVGESVLFFIHEQDTTTISVSTEYLYIDELSLTGNTYWFHSWENKEDFSCGQSLPGPINRTVCKSSLPFAHYQLDEGSPFLRRMLAFKTKQFATVNLEYNLVPEPPEEEDEELVQQKKLTASLQAIFSTSIRAIYPVATNNYLIAEEYVNGNGNHYYDNIKLTLVAMGEDKVTYLPFEPLDEELYHFVDERGSLVFSQHQSLYNYLTLKAKYNHATQTIDYCYLRYASIADSEATIFVQGSYKFQHGCLIPWDNK